MRKRRKLIGCRVEGDERKVDRRRLMKEMGRSECVVRKGSGKQARGQEAGYTNEQINKQTDEQRTNREGDTPSSRSGAPKCLSEHLQTYTLELNNFLIL